MKRLLLPLLLLAVVAPVAAQRLVMIRPSGLDDIRQMIQNPDYQVHFHSDAYVVATTRLPAEATPGAVTLDNAPWAEGVEYFAAHLEPAGADDYLAQLGSATRLMLRDGNTAFLRHDTRLGGRLAPQRSDAMTRIAPGQARLAQPNRIPKAPREADPAVAALLNQVNADSLLATVQHLQDYGTRECHTPQAFQAQDWIEMRFQQYGLATETQGITVGSQPASDNVIATIPGTKYPTEHVVVGCHYDSYTFTSTTVAPGADDNATGVAGVLEIARLLHASQPDRTIVLCAFSGEEYGLYGSAAYAERCASQGMDILGYFNIDMVGYRQAGTELHTSLIRPASADELAAFYTAVAATYLPQLSVGPGMLSGGDSDHTSFNRNGYMGIYPFEHADHYSPHIHTSNDLIGPSLNDTLFAATMVRAALASVHTMANAVGSPRGLVAVPADGAVRLAWNPLPDADHFRVFRDGEQLTTTTTNTYIDNDVQNGVEYAYHVTAVYSDSGQESEPSNTATATPMTHIAPPYATGFEAGDDMTLWTLGGGWGATSQQQHDGQSSLTDSPDGNYGNNLDIAATLAPLDMTLAQSAQLTFWLRHATENNYDKLFVEISTNSSTWVQLATYTGTLDTWAEQSFDLTAYAGQPHVRLRLRLKSDSSVAADGVYIDDLAIDITALPQSCDPVAELQATWSEQAAAVRLAWQPASPYATGYRLYRDGAELAHTTALTHDDATAQPGRTHTYAIEAEYADCVSGRTEATIEVPQATGMEAAGPSPARVYPNPSRGRLTVAPAGGGQATVELVDAQGRPALRRQISGQATIDTSGLPAGLYLLRMEGAHGATTHKIVINK